jgi:hypothetical protein
VGEILGVRKEGEDEGLWVGERLLGLEVKAHSFQDAGSNGGKQTFGLKPIFFVWYVRPEAEASGYLIMLGIR